MSFSRILRSSAIMGGASVVVMATGLLRGKVVAHVLGPAGVGMMGVLNQLITMLTQILGFGIGTSTVRHVAGLEGESRDIQERLVYHFAVKLALLGAAVAVLIAIPICWATFGTLQNLSFVMAASLAVPFAIVAAALSSILQARGHIPTIARTQIASALLTFVLGVPMIWYGGMWGLVAALVIATAGPLLVVGRVIRIRFNGIGETFTTSKGTTALVRMGIALIGTVVVSQVSAYLTRLAVVHQLGLEQAGFYQAAFSIAGTIPAFVFVAMGTDFYPRVAAAKDEADSLAVTDRQIKAGVVLATPCFAGLVLFGGWLLRLFYSAEFIQAMDLLRLMTWGVACRLVSWPLGYWLMARATPRELFWLEGIGSILVAGLTFLLVPLLGLMGAGVAFLAGSILYGVIVALFVRHRTGQGISTGSFLWMGWAIVALAVAQVVSLRPSSALVSSGVLVLIAAASLIGYYFALKKERLA
jgi:antigen flippase